MLLFALFGAYYVFPPQGSDRVLHLSAIIEARNALSEGQFPPRVAPHFAGAMRYPVFQFYGALPYGLAGGLALVPGVDAYDAWKVVTFLAVTCAGFYAYRCGLLMTRQVWPSVVAGVVFVTAPYLSTDFRARFAFTEAVSFCLLPAVLYYSLRAFMTHRPGAVVAAAVAWAALALSHNITNLYGSVLLGLFALSLAGPDPRKFVRRLARVAVAYVAGVALAAWYVMPQLRVLDYLVMTTDNTAASPVGSTVWAPLYALLSPVLTIAPEARNSPYLGVQVGWPILAAVAVALVQLTGAVTVNLARRRMARRDLGLHRPGAWMLARLLAALALAFFVAWSPVDFWPYVPKLFYNLQITYRLLMFVVLWGSVLAAMVLAAMWRRTPGGMPAGAAWVCVLAAAVAAIPFQGWGLDRISGRTLKRLEDAPVFGPAEYQYKTVPAKMERYRLDVPAGAALMTSAQVSPHVRAGPTTRIDLAPDRRVVAQLPVLFYPGLIDVRDNGGVAERVGQVDGQLAVELAPGRHQLTVKFVGLRWANALSVAAWAAVLAACGLAFARSRRNRGLQSRLRRRPEFPVAAAAFGFMVMVAPLAVPAAAAYRARKSTARATGIVLPSSEAFPGARAMYAFDGNAGTEWVTTPGPSAWLVVMPPAPREVSSVELEPRQTDVLGGWHRVTVVLYRGDQTVARQTFELPDAARQPLQVLELEGPVVADGVELRFSEPVTLTRTGDRHVPPEFCYSGYREIRIR